MCALSRRVFLKFYLIVFLNYHLRKAVFCVSDRFKTDDKDEYTSLILMMWSQ